MDKVRILHFFVGNRKGGGTQAVLENWRVINRERFEFGFVKIGSKWDAEKDVIASGGKVYYIPCRSEEDEEGFQIHLRRIFSLGYDIAHIHLGKWTGSLVEKVAKEYNVKVIYHSHNTEVSLIEEYERMHKAREHHLARRNKLVYDSQVEYWSCTFAAAQWMYGDKIEPDKIKIVKDAIDTKRFRYNYKIREEIRNRYGISDKFVLGHIGRFSYQKNQEFLIPVLEGLRNRGIDTVLLVEGLGNQKNKFCEKTREHKLDDKVIMLENYQQIEELYQAMDMFVFPSRFEGFGRVLLEAQCAGLKCISSNLVPEDVKVTANVTFEELCVGKWIEDIEDNMDYNRCDMSKEILDAGYDLEQNVRELEILYQYVANK